MKRSEAWRAEPRTTRGGQPWYSPLAILTALTLRAVFRLALRQTEGLIGSILRLLGLDLAVPDHTTLSRRAGTLEVPRARSGTGPLHLLVDSTGLKLGGPGRVAGREDGSRTRRAWRKLHLGVDAGTGRIEAVELTTKDADDASRVGPWQGFRFRSTGVSEVRLRNPCHGPTREASSASLVVSSPASIRPLRHGSTRCSFRQDAACACCRASRPATRRARPASGPVLSPDCAPLFFFFFFFFSRRLHITRQP